MIKAYGRCGDLKTAFLLVDEMLGKNMKITVETYTFVLQACASDKEFGFRHALLVWHKMYQQNLTPSLYAFNTMLRCCRDTELGDLPTTKEVVQTILLRNPEKPKDEIKLIDTPNEGVQIVEKISEEQPTLPNLLAPKPYLGKMIDINEVKKPEDRLILLGGFTGFLELMKQFDVKPDLKTYTLLIEIVPSTRAAENILLRAIRKDKIKCDVDFFNVLMKKRSMRFDYEGAKEVK
jgi:pentatricopeptide repeat domain-containing protein 1